MRILQIGLLSPSNKIQKTNNKSTTHNFAVTRPLAVDTVSFGRVAENAEKMRSLFKYKMIDIHTGQPLIDPEWFKESLQNGLFEHSIQHIVKTLKPFEECLHKVEAELFSKMERFAKTNPLYRLDDVIQRLAPKAQADLLELQRPIFEKLKKISAKLPSEQKQAFDELMENAEKQLVNKPITYKFSKKEFKYQLERIAQDTKRRGIADEVKSVEKLLNMANKLPYSPSGRNFSRRNPKFNPDKQLTQANMIRQMSNYLSRSVLKSDKAINDLFLNAKKQVFNIPTVIPFKRKTFNHELQSITDTLKDEKLAREIMKIASTLPTAQEELSAFIMKSSRYSSTKIGHELLYGSVGAIDHLEPYSHGGADAMENYAFTSNIFNAKRGNKTIEKWIKQNPDTITGSQKCADRLIELYRDGTFDKEGLTPWYIINFAKRMNKLSNGKINLDLGTFPKELGLR